jgi:hypothetical protein
MITLASSAKPEPSCQLLFEIRIDRLVLMLLMVKFLWWLYKRSIVKT